MRLRRVEGQKHRLLSQSHFVFGSVWYVTEFRDLVNLPQERGALRGSGFDHERQGRDHERQGRDHGRKVRDQEHEGREDDSRVWPLRARP